jgi:hypothetical protein
MLTNQDFARNRSLPKDLVASSAQVPETKRPDTGEGRGGGVTQSTVIIPQCHHVKPDGIRCGSPALRGRPLCYFHARPRKVPRPQPQVLPDLRNPMAMLRWTIANLATGRIDTKAAGQIIYAVQQLVR